jgi:hypothetical protein
MFSGHCEKHSVCDPIRAESNVSTLVSVIGRATTKRWMGPKTISLTPTELSAIADATDRRGRKKD